MRESDIERALVRTIAAQGGMAVKLNVFGHRGMPDRLVLLPGGRLVFVELKVPGKRPTVLQVRTHEKLRALGFEVRVIDNKAQAEAGLW